MEQQPFFQNVRVQLVLPPSDNFLPMYCGPDGISGRRQKAPTTFTTRKDPVVARTMHRRWWLVVIGGLYLCGLLLVANGFPLNLGGPPTLVGEFTLGNQAESVSGHVLERDFRHRLRRSGSGAESVTCHGDLGASLGSTARCDAQFGKSWKTGSPQAVRTSSGWLADRADYAVTHVEGRKVEFAITPGLSVAMLENALARDLITASYLLCPQEGISGVAGTTVSCQANYGFSDDPCSDLRRCTLLVGIQNVSGFSLDLKILQVTPPA